MEFFRRISDGHMNHQKKNAYFPSYWLFNRYPYDGFCSMLTWKFHDLNIYIYVSISSYEAILEDQNHIYHDFLVSGNL